MLGFFQPVFLGLQLDAWFPGTVLKWRPWVCESGGGWTKSAFLEWSFFALWNVNL